MHQLSAAVLQMTSLALSFAAAYMGSVSGFGGSPMRFTTRCTKHSATPSDSSTGEESSVFFVIFFRPFAFERIDLRCRLWNDVKWPKLTYPTVADKLIASAYLVLFCCFSSSALTYLFPLNTLLIHKYPIGLHLRWQLSCYLIAPTVCSKMVVAENHQFIQACVLTQ